MELGGGARCRHCRNSFRSEQRFLTHPCVAEELRRTHGALLRRQLSALPKTLLVALLEELLLADAGEESEDSGRPHNYIPSPAQLILAWRLDSLQGGGRGDAEVGGRRTPPPQLQPHHIPTTPPILTPQRSRSLQPPQLTPQRPATDAFGFIRRRAAVYLRELPCVPYALSFYSSLTAALHDLGLLPSYDPLGFAASFLKSIPYINQWNRTLYCVHPFRNEALFREVSGLFDVSLVVLACDSRGQRRALIDVYGTGEEALRQQIALVFVTDSAAFHETVERGDVVEPDARWESELLPRGGRVLSSESKAVLAAVEASLAAARLRRQEQEEEPRRPPSPAIAPLSTGNEEDVDEEEEQGDEDPGIDPFRPPVATFPMHARLDRWIQCLDVEAFLSTYHCRKQCGSWFSQSAHRRQHEETCVRNEDADEDARFLSLRYSQDLLRPKVRLLDQLATLGYRLSAEETSPRGLLAADIETLQDEEEEEEEPEDQKLKPPKPPQLERPQQRKRFAHSVFLIGWSAALQGRDGRIEDEVLVGPRFRSGYDLVEAFVARLRALAVRHRELELARAAPLLDAMKRDLNAAEGDNPGGSTAKALRKVICALERRLSTLTIGFWNGSGFDLRVLISEGFYAALKHEFQDISILKRGSRYLTIVAKGSPANISLRFCDYMLMNVRCSLDSYLRSHAKLLGRLRAEAGEEADAEADVKGSVPYHNLHKAVNDQGEDSGYQWLLEDFVSPLDGLNALGRERRRFEAALGEMEGDEERALRSIGASAPPDTAEEVFHALCQSWQRRQLHSALQVLIDYQIRDTRPLLQISLHMQAVCMQETNLSVFLDAATVSSFAWGNMMSVALRGKNRLLLYPLKPWLMRELRSQLVGGPSFCIQRLVKKGQPIPDQTRLSADQPPDPQHRQASELTQCTKSLDANGLYGHCMSPALHGQPVYRHRSDGFIGRVDDSATSTFAALWLAFVEQSGQYGVQRIQSLYTGSEAFVVINRQQYQAEIQQIYNETIGAYLESLRVSRMNDEGGMDEEEADWEVLFKHHDQRQRRDQCAFTRLSRVSPPSTRSNHPTHPHQSQAQVGQEPGVQSNNNIKEHWTCGDDDDDDDDDSSSLSGFVVSDEEDGELVADRDDAHQDKSSAERRSSRRRRISSSSSSCTSITPSVPSAKGPAAAAESTMVQTKLPPPPPQPPLHPYAEASSLQSLRLSAKNRREAAEYGEGSRLNRDDQQSKRTGSGVDHLGGTARRHLSFPAEPRSALPGTCATSNDDDDDDDDNDTSVPGDGEMNGGQEAEEADDEQVRESELNKWAEREARHDQQRQRRRQRDGETLRKRFSASASGLMRWRVDGMVREPSDLKLVLEALTCGGGHGPCPCPTCPFNRHPELVERRRFADGRSLGRMRADDSFRRRMLELAGYRVVEKWSCEWDAEVAVEGSEEADFAQSHSLLNSPKRLPLRQSFSEAQLLEALLSRRTQGLVKCAVTIPQHQRQRCQALAPLFVNLEIDYRVTRGPMRNYLRWLGSHDKPSKTLLSVFAVKSYLTTSRLLCFLAERFDAVIYDIEYFVELEFSEKLKEYTTAMVEKRRQADADQNEVLASYAKLSVNSAFGTSLFRAERNTTTRLVGEEGWERAFSKGTLAEAAFVGPPTDRQSLVELTTLPRRITVKSPILIGFCILTEAKINLLNVFDFLSKMLRPTAWCLNGGDTDSLNASFSHESMRACVREECLEEFDRRYPTLFADPSKPQTKRELGLWKVEFQSDDLCYVYKFSRMYT